MAGPRAACRFKWHNPSLRLPSPAGAAHPQERGWSDEVFGKAFEQYAGEVLERTFPVASGLVSPLARNVGGRSAAGEQFEIDAVLN